MIAIEPSPVQAPEQKIPDGWFTPGRFALLLAALIIACFPKVVFGSATFFFRDFGAFGYPLALYHREAFWRGEMPLWNPYSVCGVPFLAQWNTLTLYPPSLFYLLFPLSWSLGVFNLTHMFLAGMGMYFLAHRWTDNRLAGAVAGIIYAFNGLTWDALMWPNNIAALGWTPWVVLWVQRAWQKGGVRNVAVAGLSGAVQMLSGAPEVIILTWFAIGIIWLSEWIGGDFPRGPMLGRALGVGILVAGLSAAQLLPFADLLLHSQRSTSFGTSDWSMPLGGWRNYLVPLFHCSRDAQSIYTAQGQYWTSSYYLGIGAIALMLLALWRARDRRTWVLALLALFGFTMALGDSGVVYAVVRKVFPAMGFMRFPIKFVVLVTFTVPLLAARAVSWWQSLTDTRLKAGRNQIWQIGFALAAVMAVILRQEWTMHRPASENPAIITQNALLRLAFLVLILGAFVWLRNLKSFRWQCSAQVALLLLLWFDVFTHNNDLSPTVDRSVYQPDLMRQYHSQEGDSAWSGRLGLDSGRAMLTVGALSSMTFHAVGAAKSDYFGRRLSLLYNCNLLDHVPKFDGFYSLCAPQTSRLIIDVYMSTNSGVKDMPGLKNFLGVTEINSPADPTEWIPRDTALPLITAGQQPTFAEDPVALQEMLGARFDPTQFVLLPPDTKKLVTITNQSNVKILSRHFTAQDVRTEVDATTPAMVVVAQSYYHPWHAYVDGHATPLFRANYAFQALEVPAGRHMVRLAYEDTLFHVGGGLSLGSLAVCLVFLLRRPKVQPAY